MLISLLKGEYELWSENIVGDADVVMLLTQSQVNQFGT